MKNQAVQNIFADLGFPHPEAENLRIRADMIEFIRKNKLTQVRAAKALGITQPRVSDLIRGRIHRFSIDNLVVLLAAAGLRVDVKFKKVA